MNGQVTPCPDAGVSGRLGPVCQEASPGVSFPAGLGGRGPRNDPASEGTRSRHRTMCILARDRDLRDTPVLVPGHVQELKSQDMSMGRATLFFAPTKSWKSSSRFMSLSAGMQKDITLCLYPRYPGHLALRSTTSCDMYPRRSECPSLSLSCSLDHRDVRTAVRARSCHRRANAAPTLTEP